MNWLSKSILGGLTLIVMGCTQPSGHKQPSFLDEWMQPTKELKVLSTTAMIDNIVGEIGQEHIYHMALIQGQLDPHSYELVKGDNEKIASADLIFYNGLELEHGASLKYSLTAHPKAYSLGEVLSQTETLIFEGEQVDPHVWMDVRLFSSIIEPIVKKLSEQDPSHAQVFQHNGEVLRQKMLQLDAAIYRKMQSIPKERRYLITSHDAFFYFARRYLADQSELENALWRGRFAAPEGLAPDGQISPKDIQQIIQYAAEYEVQVIFSESNLNQDALRKIISVLNQKGIRAFLAPQPLYGDAMGDQGSSADTYLRMMEHNASVIEAGLKGGIHG